MGLDISLQSSDCADRRQRRADRTLAMDQLGQRIIEDRAKVNELRSLARELEGRAKRARDQADEIERLLDLARLEQ